MTKFEECKSEWLKYAQEEKILIVKVKKKIEIVINQQNEMGDYFSFPRYETINNVKKYHYFFRRIETEEILKCPCCESIYISQSKIHFPINEFYIISECSSCGYFGIEFKIPSRSYYLYEFNYHSLKHLNSQLDRYLKNNESNKQNKTKKLEEMEKQDDEYFQRTHR